MEYNLNRFLSAQQDYYELALCEINEGRKRSHWVWFIFPQLKGLGYSYNSKYFGLAGFDEARAYLRHEVLGDRLRKITEVLLSHAGSKSAVDILGGVDALKVRSSMTLFDCVSPDDIFAEVLERLYLGRKCTFTQSLLNQ